jgi:hypothetical protein
MSEATPRPPFQGKSEATKPERCAMLEMGRNWDTFLSHDSARRITRVGVAMKDTYSQKQPSSYVVEVKYLLPSGYESTIESIRFHDSLSAANCMHDLVNLLKQAVGFC